MAKAGDNFWGFAGMKSPPFVVVRDSRTGERKVVRPLVYEDHRSRFS